MANPVRAACIAACAFFFLTSPLLSKAAAPPPDAVTADGGRYYGPLVDGKFHGRGRLEWENGARYEGEFNKGRYSGRGRLKLGSGDVYEGNFRDGLMSGRGRMQMMDGSIYVGEFRKDTFNGKGRHERKGGDVYEGTFAHGDYHGQGRLVARDSKYQGEFRHGEYWGHGELVHDDGAKYSGAFVRGRWHGKGRFENANGEVYEGDFVQNEFTGSGTLTRKGGGQYRGDFLKWRKHGAGVYTDRSGNVYEGKFVDDELEGPGRLTWKGGGRYEGEFRQWRFHGQGVLHLPNGDIYKGGFERGLYEGEGTLTYAKPMPDGRVQDSGVWRFGMLQDEKERQQARINVETALYNQSALLGKALAALQPREPGKINMYLLAVAGDGSQEVFRREAEFVRDAFASRFRANGRSLVLINSRNTVATMPMATVTSIRESLKGIASRMDKEQDILFLFLTGHGSKEHEFSLNQNSMELRGLRAAELGELLKEVGIRWKVVVVSACYSGGFIDHVKDEHTLVITAARHDRRSFGCADENDFTYFGRAYFKEALPKSKSFQDAFHKAAALVTEWESKELKADGKKVDADFSVPQIFNPAPIEDHLRRWWTQWVE